MGLKSKRSVISEYFPLLEIYYLQESYKFKE